MQKMKACPFCGKHQSGKEFVSSSRGPMVICRECGANGPPPLPNGESYQWSEATEKRLERAAIRMWNMVRAELVQKR